MMAIKYGFLPVGSIVLLKEAKRKVVVIGYAIKEVDNTKIWDYLGAPYPIGVISSEKNLLFDKTDIDDVYFLGYQDDECKDFLDELDSNIKRIKIDGNN